jgi:phospholipid transport system substrate-binding protein
MKKIFIIMSTCLLLSTSVAWGEESPMQFAKERQAAIFRGGSKVELEIDKALDYQSLIINSMGLYWGSLSDVQKSEVSTSLKSIIRSSLKKRLTKVDSKDVTWTGIEPKGENIFIVKSFVETRKPIQEIFEIDYTVIKNPDGYRIIDVIFDGVSTLENYRRQFNKIIKLKGIDGLILKLKERSNQNLIEGDGCQK